MRKDGDFMSIRTLAAWKLYTGRTGETDISSFLNVGDIVSEDLAYSLMDISTENTPSVSYFQTAEPFGYCYDLGAALRPIFATFAESGGIWRYYGHCFQFETINRY